MKTTSETTPLKRLTLAFAAGVAFLAGSAHAQSINVNFNGFTGGNLQSEVESTLSGPAGGLATSWNQYAANSSAGAMLDSTGAATTVTFTSTWSEGRTGNVNDLPIFRSTLTDFGKGIQGRNLTINGLTPAGLYDIWVMAYRDAADAAERLGAYWSTANATTSTSTQLLSSFGTQNGTTFEYGVNYVLFENVAADGSGVITFTANAGLATDPDFTANVRSGLSGFQLRPAQAAGPVDASVSTVRASPTAVLADGSSTSTVTVGLKDAIGKSVSGKDVTLANTGAGPLMAAILPLSAQTTDAVGEAIFTVSSSTEGVEEFTATDVTDSNLVITQTANVEFEHVLGPVDITVSTVAASPTTVVADGALTSTITVTLKDAAGFAVAGKDVTLANTSGPQMADILPVTAQTTDVNGAAIFTVSSNTAGVEEFTATDVTDTLVITQTASVTFDPLVIGPVDIAVSTVVASPGAARANGSETSTITVTLKDAAGYAVESKDVTLAGNSSADILPLTAQTTDVNGKATFTVSSNTIGLEEFTATDVTDTLVITQTASVNFTDPNAPVLVNITSSKYTGGNAVNLTTADLEGPGGLGAGTSWNVLGTNSGAALLDSTGVSTGITFATTAGESRGTSTEWVLEVLRTYWQQFGKGADQTVTLGGLTPGGFYDITLTSLAPVIDSGAASTEGGAGIWSTTNATTSSSAQSIDNTTPPKNTSTWVVGYNYVVFEKVEANGSGNIVFLGNADGIDADELNIGLVAGAHRLQLNSLQLLETTAPPSGTPYDTWAATNAPTGNPDDDFDGDGVSNAVEFVLGGLATTNDLDKLPAVATSGGDMTFTFVRDQTSIDAATTVTIEVGTDLQTWNTPPSPYAVPDTATVGPPVAVVDNLNGTDTVTLTVAQAPDAKKFARLKVVITP